MENKITIDEYIKAVHQELKLFKKTINKANTDNKEILLSHKEWSKLEIFNRF